MHVEGGLSTLIASLPTPSSVDEVANAVLAYGHQTYLARTPAANLVEFEHGPATYLFDHSSETRVERTVAVVARPTSPDGPRDATYQRGFPPARSGAGGHWTAATSSPSAVAACSVPTCSTRTAR